jgi:hypothetical protein
MPKVLTTTIAKYRVDTIVILLDHAQASQGQVQVVGIDAAVARVTDQGAVHDQRTVSLLGHLTPQRRQAVEGFIQGIVQAMKQAEEVE